MVNIAKLYKSPMCLKQCRRYGGARGAVPPYRLLVPPFYFTQNTVFGISLNDKTTDNVGKKNNYVQTSFDVFWVLCEIAGNQLLCHINLARYFVLLTGLYGCVAEETCKHTDSLPLLR